MCHVMSGKVDSSFYLLSKAWFWRLQDSGYSSFMFLWSADREIFKNLTCTELCPKMRRLFVERKRVQDLIVCIVKVKVFSNWKKSHVSFLYSRRLLDVRMRDHYRIFLRNIFYPFLKLSVSMRSAQLCLLKLLSQKKLLLLRFNLNKVRFNWLLENIS